MDTFSCGNWTSSVCLRGCDPLSATPLASLKIPPRLSPRRGDFIKCHHPKQEGKNHQSCNSRNRSGRQNQSPNNRDQFRDHPAPPVTRPCPHLQVPGPRTTPRATSPPRPWISRATFAIAHNVDQPYRSSVHRQPQSPLPIRSSSSPFIPGMPPLFVGHWASSPTCLQPS
jgi:hypothetical protein